MQLRYTVSESGGLWYAHAVRFPGIPCMINERSTFGTKRNALENAAMMQGLIFKEYMELRREQGTGGGVRNYIPQKEKVRNGR